MRPRFKLVRSSRARAKALAFLFLPLLSACATWSRHGVAANPPEKIRIAVLPVKIAVRVKRMSTIKTVPKGEALPNEPRLIDQEMRAAADDITTALEARLSSSYFFTVIADSEVRRALASEGLDSATATLTSAQFQSFGRALGAQAVLATDLSGYGSIKKRWLFYLIGSGLLEGAAQGAVVATAVSSPWVAVGVAAEEMTSETLEWGGGAYLFGRFWSPVILEGRLISTADGKTVWSKTALESGDRKAVKALPKDERNKRELRLRLTARKAAAVLVKKLDRRAWANLEAAGPSPAASH